MSVEAMAIVLNHSRARGAAKLVLLGIANHINPDNDGAWPSQAKLAQYANVSDRAVRDAVEALVALGELHYEVGAGTSATQYKTNRYWLTLRCPDSCDGTVNHRNRVEVSANQGGSFQQSGWKQASDKPLREPELRTSFPQASLADEFDEFWKVYPRKEDKNAARRAFKRARLEATLETIVEGAKRYRDDPNRAASFTKYPATWLNAGAWENGPLPEREMSAEERAEIQRAEAARKAAADREATRLLREEMAEQQRRYEANKPAYCEHGRIKVICKKCPPPDLN